MEIQALNQLQTPLEIEPDLREARCEREEAPRTEEPLSFDFWSFGSYWELVKDSYHTLGNLYGAIKEKIQTLFSTRETFRGKILKNETLESIAFETRADGTYLIDPENLKRIKKGVSGSYFLYDAEGRPRFIVKPTDEDAGCINNPKGYATPFEMSPIRKNMPLYLSAFREAAVWEIAEEIGVGSIAPKTQLAILESWSFSNFSERVSQNEIDSFLEQVGETSREKLCSVQEFVPNSKSLFEALHELQAKELSDEEIAARFDQADFEDTNILLWTTQDTDGHSGNFLCYPKGSDSFGNEILGIKKIDNGLAFPDKNGQLRNHLKNLPNAQKPLSDAAKAKIAAIDVEAVVQTLEKYNLGSTVEAFRTRMAKLKSLSQKPDITIKKINHEMGKLK